MRPFHVRDIAVMTTRTVLLLASAAALGIAAPAAAQEGHHDGHGQDHHGSEHQGAEHHSSEHHADTITTDGRYEGAWQGDWSDEETWHGEWTGTYTNAEGQTVDASYHGVFMGEHRFMSEDGHVLAHGEHGWREHHTGSNANGSHHAPRLAYTAQERAQWLTDCQYLMADGGGYYDDRRDRNGGLIGGLLGAVVGGVAGNRIADDDRLLGTAVGAGLGGLAGAAIGSVLDGDGDGELSRNEVWASRYCEAYLRRHELGGGQFAYGQQVMMVPVTTHSQFGRVQGPARARGHGHNHAQRRDEDCRICRETVIEEEVEIVRPASRPRPRPTPRPAPQAQPQGKLTPLS